jgi:hypothetical protein
MPGIKAWLVQREENASESFDLFLVSTSSSILPQLSLPLLVILRVMGEIGDASRRDF